MTRVDVIANYKLMKALLKNKLYEDLESVIDDTLAELKAEEKKGEKPEKSENK